MREEVVKWSSLTQKLGEGLLKLKTLLLDKIYRLGYTFLSGTIKASLIWNIHESMSNELLSNFSL